MSRRLTSGAVACAVLASFLGTFLGSFLGGCPAHPEASKASAHEPPAASAPAAVEKPAQKPADEAAEPAASEASVQLSPPGREPARVRIEIARTEPERRVGLMHRKHLDADAGMLFLFEAPQQLSFWMRNTYVPLDMIFITDAMVVLGIVENAEPLTETPRAVPGRSQYVLEVNAGYSRAHGIEPGTVVRFDGVGPAEATR